MTGRHTTRHGKPRRERGRALRATLLCTLALVVAAAVGVLITQAGHTAGRPHTVAISDPVTPSAAARPSSAGPTARTHPPRKPPADPLGAAATSYAATREGSVLAEVYDLDAPGSWQIGDGPAQDTASIVKLDILETLLRTHPAGLTASQQKLATSMITDSDNDAATSLWYAAGGRDSISGYNSAAGLTRTGMPSCVDCAGFPWPGWGLTTTVPADQITLLRQVVQPSRLLTAAQRGYALNLMEHVTPDQDWGVSGGVPDSATVALKNGWLPLNSASTDWQVNSIGWVHGDGRSYLIAVMTTGDPSMDYGIDTINELSAQVWQRLG